MLAAIHLKFTAQATHPVVAARQVPTPSALLQALVVHQAVALPVRVVAAKRLQQALIITSGQSSVGLSTNSPGATSSTSTGAGQSCCSFATAEEAFSSISQTGGCPYFSFFPTEQSKQFKV